MGNEPPRQLVDVLERLELASAGQVARVERRAARLARDLPRFESVWIDALVQTQLLTAYQAAELNAGRGEQLAVGPFVLAQPVAMLGYATCYEARRRGSRQTVQLVVAEVPSPLVSATEAQFQALAQRAELLRGLPLCPVEQTGYEGERLWAASAYHPGRTALEWMVNHGRFPPELVLEMARQMLVGLERLERVGLWHGDLRASGVVLTAAGEVVLSPPGLRPILRPAEGVALADLAPEAYDYLAPERLTAGTPPTAASEIYACGCLWWHLLAGRPPRSGGDSLAKLRAVQSGAIPAIDQFVPEMPPPLAAALTAALQRDPRQRPESFQQLRAVLGPPTPLGQKMLVRGLRRRGEPADRWAAPVGTERRGSQAVLVWAVIGGCLVMAAVLGWSMRKAARPPASAERAVTATSSSPPVSLSPSSANDQSHSSGEPAMEVPRLTLPGGAVALEAAALRPGQTVAGMPDARPLLVIPADGLVLAQENLTFENVDFVWRAPAGASRGDAAATMLHVRAARIAFRGCSFRAARPDGPLPIAIQWSGPPETPSAELALPSGELCLVDCVFRYVAVGVDCPLRGAWALDASNTLYLGEGPWLQFPRWPAVEEPIVLRLSGVTLRGCGPLLETPGEPGGRGAGRLTVRAAGCVLAPAPAAALLHLTGAAAPPPGLAGLEWSGQGSLVTPETLIADWQDPQGVRQPLEDRAIAIAGLVRSTVEFAGPLDTGPAGSQVVRWQGPLQSANAPGIDPARLREPRR